MRPSDIQEMPDENAEPKEDDEKKTKKNTVAKGEFVARCFFVGTSEKEGEYRHLQKHKQKK